MTSGSPLWQMVFISFAAILILFEIVRGWRLGLLRQLVRICAVLVAYAAAFFGGPLALPLLRPLVKIPDIVISALAGALLAVVVYLVLTGVGTMLFKRTGQQNSGTIRLLYGLSGAALGVLFGGLLVWLLVVGIRAVGTIAEAEAQSEASRGAFRTYERSLPENYPAPRLQPETSGESASLITSLARLKNSIELGAVGNAFKTADVIPSSTYQTLGKVGQVFSNPQSAQRFLSYPGPKDLTQHPKIVALRNDPEIMEKIAQGRLFDLLQDQRLIDAANDPTLIEQIKKFEFQRALDYATDSQR